MFRGKVALDSQVVNEERVLMSALERTDRSTDLIPSMIKGSNYTSKAEADRTALTECQQESLRGGGCMDIVLGPDGAAPQTLLGNFVGNIHGEILPLTPDVRIT